jgi:hypothetical protein
VTIVSAGGSCPAVVAAGSARGGDAAPGLARGAATAGHPPRRATHAAGHPPRLHAPIVAGSGMMFAITEHDRRCRAHRQADSASPEAFDASAVLGHGPRSPLQASRCPGRGAGEASLLNHVRRCRTSHRLRAHGAPTAPGPGMFTMRERAAPLPPAGGRSGAQSEGVAAYPASAVGPGKWFSGRLAQGASCQTRMATRCERFLFTDCEHAGLSLHMRPGRSSTRATVGAAA